MQPRQPHRAAVDRGTPQRRQNTPNTASDAATRRSHHTPTPAPGHRVALDRGDDRLREQHAGRAHRPSPSAWTRLPRPVAMALRSAPAQKVPPAPVSTATRGVVVGVEGAEGGGERRAVGPSTALRTSGRDRMTVVTGPLRSVRTDMLAIVAEPKQRLR